MAKILAATKSQKWMRNIEQFRQASAVVIIVIVIVCFQFGLKLYENNNNAEKNRNRNGFLYDVQREKERKKTDLMSRMMDLEAIYNYQNF